MGNVKNHDFEAMVRKREDAFRGLFVGTRSGFLGQGSGAVIYSRLETLEAPFRRLMNDAEAEVPKIERLRDCYAEIHEDLASMDAEANEHKQSQEVLPLSLFAPLFRAIKESEISFGDLLYAPLLRKTPDSRLESLTELLELKRRLWPGLAS